MKGDAKPKRAPKKAADPMAEAFAIAERLAPAGVRAWLIHGYDSTEQRGNDTSAVYDALVRSGRQSIDPQDVVIAALDQYVTDSDVRLTAIDATTSLLTNALDAGYLYGLAVGLSLSKGGTR